MKEIPTELLIVLLDSAIDELAKAQKRMREVKEITFNACKLIDLLTQQVANLERENEFLRCSESFHETRDYNRSRKIGMQLQEGNNG